MMIQELSRNTTETHTYITLAVDNKQGFVGFNRETGEVQVICQNASHKAFFGAGKFFRNFEQAVNGYKSAAMKAIINTAKELVA